MAQLRCPKCGSTDVYCGGMNPVQCNARCRHCGFEVTGSIKIGRYFGGKASYATYVAEKEAEDAFRKAGEKTVQKGKSSAVKSSTKKKSGKKAKEVSVSRPADSQQDTKNKEPSVPQQLSLFDCYES